MRGIVSIIIAWSCITVSSISFAQDKYDIGLELAAARGSNFGGTIGLSAKFGFLKHTGETETLVYGPSLRYQYWWNNNPVLGTGGQGAIWGGGGFLHYRFFDWLFVGSDVEVIKNPIISSNPDKRWALTTFVGGGLHHDFDFVKLNLGIMYDVADGIRERLRVSNPTQYNTSPFRQSYFIPRTDPTTGQNAGFLPIIYRITFFFGIGQADG